MGKTSGIKGTTSAPVVIFLIDHNLKGHARILLGSIAGQGWLDVVPNTANYTGARRVFIP